MFQDIRFLPNTTIGDLSMAITAAMVKELRVKTDAPMMECKRALTEANGDMTRAEEILRVKLGNKANKAAVRIAAEGVVVVDISDDKKVGAVLEVNSETDFVAKNPEFIDMAKNAVRLVREQNPADLSALSALTVDGKSLEEIRKALVGKIGENMTFRRFTRLEAKGSLHSYVHSGSKIAAVVDVTGGDDELAHDLAMHIAACKPKALDASGVDPELIAKEKRVAIEKARESGKPENLIERIAEGTVQKFLKEVTLLNQPFVKDDKISVKQLLAQKHAAVNGFVLYVVGEGIEKKKNDFASEVAEQMAAAKKA